MKTWASIACVLAVGCGAKQTSAPPPAEPTKEAVVTFEDEVAFLKKYGPVEVLEDPGGARIAISGQYQARVMTSAVAPGAASLGFINHKFIEAGKTDTQFDNYGGEDRFWLGPEAGQFGLYFPAGKPFVIANWQTPFGLQRGAWAARERGDRDIVYENAVDVTNYSGTELHVLVRRGVTLLRSSDIESRLGIAPPTGVQSVAFETDNAIDNYGDAWTKEKGLVSIWILGMYNPSPDTNVIVPFASDASSSAVVNDKYFGKVPDDRLAVHDDRGFLVFKCDGNHRSKIGLGPKRAKSVLGSYSAQAKLLTIVQFNKPDDATDYVNSMWEQQENPYGGDVVNSYNDGPTEPGKPSLGGFYEMETSSPAIALAGRGAPVHHIHRTFHFVGDASALDAIATRVLGVSLTSL
jgi:hypothetical protein